MTTENLIKLLIRNDLINMKLVYGLGDLGLNADSYLLYTSEIIFELMGFTELQQTDELTDQYVSMTSRVKLIDAEEMHDEIKFMAQEIYLELMFIKTGRAA